MTNRQELAGHMHTLFHVWRGTEHAEEILEDVCLVLGVNVLKIPHSDTDTRELARFVDECRGRNVIDLMDALKRTTEA